MPVNPEVTPEYFEKKLKEWEVFQKDGSLKKSSNEVWSGIKHKLNLKMKPESIYLYIYKNCNGIKENLLKYFGLDKKAEKLMIQSISKRKRNDPDYEPMNYANPNNFEVLHFELELQRKLILHETEARKQTEWVYNLNEQIRKNTQVQCIYNLKNSWFTKDLFKFNGCCTECFAGIDGSTEIQERVLTIHIQTYDTSSIEHKKKIRLAGKRRHDIQEKLLTKTANQYRAEEIAKITNDKEPRDLNDTITLHKAREEILSRIINWSEFKGSSISIMRYIQHCSIRKLALTPFYVFYWSDDQIKLWNILSEDRSLTLSFDSTGGLVRKYSFYSELTSKPIFYYVLVIGYKKKIYPLMQALLSAQHVPLLVELFDRWIDSGAAVPKEIVTDRSLALQNVVCLSFNKMTFNEYNAVCFKILRNRELISELPACYYRCDVAHLIHSVKNWKCLKSAYPETRRFYLHCIGYLTQVQTVEEFKRISEAMIVVSKSPSAEIDSSCYKNKKLFIDVIKTYRFTLLETDSEVTVESKDLPSFINEELFKEIDDGFENDEEISDKANFHHVPLFNKNFKKLCSTFPSWTAVMNELFKSPHEAGISARSETYFQQKKDEVRRNINIQKFILKDNLKIQSLMKLAGTKTKETGNIVQKNVNKQLSSITDLKNVKSTGSFDTLFIRISKREVLTSSSAVHVDEIFVSRAPVTNSQTLNFENSTIISDSVIIFPIDNAFVMNSTELNNFESTSKNFTNSENASIEITQNSLNASITEINQASIESMETETITDVQELSKNESSDEETLREFVDVISDDEDATYRIYNDALERNLLQNGLILDSVIFHNGKKIKLINTCPVDSIFEIFIAAYTMRPFFRQIILDVLMHLETLPDILNLVTDYSSSRYSRKLYYQRRHVICEKQYSLTNIEGELVTNCQDNVIRLWNTIFEKYPPAYTKTITCKKCGYKNDYKKLPV